MPSRYVLATIGPVTYWAASAGNNLINYKKHERTLNSTILVSMLRSSLFGIIWAAFVPGDREVHGNLPLYGKKKI